MEEITIQDTEIIEESTEVSDVSVDELMQMEEVGEVQTETIISYDDTVLIETLTQIQADVRILVLLSILTFCSACLRGWRNNVIKGAR